jgi:hypothetical protein
MKLHKLFFNKPNKKEKQHNRSGSSSSFRRDSVTISSPSKTTSVQIPQISVNRVTSTPHPKTDTTTFSDTSNFNSAYDEDDTIVDIIYDSQQNEYRARRGPREHSNLHPIDTLNGSSKKRLSSIPDLRDISVVRGTNLSQSPVPSPQPLQQLQRSQSSKVLSPLLSTPLRATTPKSIHTPEYSQVKDSKNRSRWSISSSGSVNFISSLQAMFPNFDYYAGTPKVEMVEVNHEKPVKQPSPPSYAQVIKDTPNSMIPTTPTTQKVTKHIIPVTPSSVVSIPATPTLTPKPVLKTQTSIQATKSVTIRVDTASCNSSDSFNISTPSSSPRGPVVNSSVNITPKSISFEDEFPLSPYSPAPKPDLEYDSLTAELKRLCQEQSEKIEKLQNKVGKLKKFKARVQKLDSITELLYTTGTELICDGWMQKKEEKELFAAPVKKGMHYLKVAAELGHACAQFEYAEMLIKHGHQDKVPDAIEYLKSSHKGGNKKALIFLQKLQQYGHYSDVNKTN